MDIDVEILGTLRTELGDEMVTDFCGQWLAEAETAARTWQSPGGASDLEELARTAHRLAGSGGSLGFSRLCALMRELERQARAGQAPVPERLREVDSALDSARVALRAALP